MSKDFSRKHGLSLVMVLLVFFFAASTAFAQDTAKFEPAQLKKNLIIGKTTRDEVKAIYGKPGHVSRAPASEGSYETTWDYDTSGRDTAAGKARKSVMGRIRNFIPGQSGYGSTATDVALEQGVGERDAKRYVLYIHYNKSGVITDYELSEYNEKKKYYE